jgi:hypothetical protein
MRISAAELRDLANPSHYSLGAAEDLTRKFAVRLPGFYLELTAFLHALTKASPPEYPAIERILLLMQSVAPPSAYQALYD